MLTVMIILGTVLPQPKVGPCPAGYVQSGGYCAPMGGTTRPAVPKVGQCPANWITSGGYCLGPKDQSRIRQ